MVPIRCAVNRKFIRNLKQRRDDLLARVRAVRARQEVHKAVSAAGQSGSILDAVARMEAKVSEAEAAVQAQSEKPAPPGKASLDARLSALEREAEITKRLDALKEKRRE